MTNLKMNPKKKVINLKKYFENFEYYDSCKPDPLLVKNQTEDEKPSLKNRSLKIVVTKLEDDEESLDDRDGPKQMLKKTPMIKKKKLEELKKKESVRKILKMKKKKPDKENVKVVKAENPCDVKMVWQSPLSEETIPKFEPKLAPKLFAIFDRKLETVMGIF